MATSDAIRYPIAYELCVKCRADSTAPTMTEIGDHTDSAPLEHIKVARTLLRRQQRCRGALSMLYAFGGNE
jgi:hypothetical protein